MRLAACEPPRQRAAATGRRAERTAAVIFRVDRDELTEHWVELGFCSRARPLGVVTDDEWATVGTPSVATPVP